MMVQMWELSQNDGSFAKCLVSAKMFNIYFYVYLMSICNAFGIENVFTFIDFSFIWIRNESENRVPPDLVRICQLGRVRYKAAIGILHFA